MQQAERVWSSDSESRAVQYFSRMCRMVEYGRDLWRGTHPVESKLERADFTYRMSSAIFTGEITTLVMLLGMYLVPW